MVSSGFAMDLCLERDDLHTRHIVQAVGSSSIEKAKSFVAQRCPSQKPNLYDTYQGVYDDPDVDAVYIGTPHTLHLRNVLDAIAAGKHVLCEKPFAMNAKEAQIIFDAAEKKGVFVMEGRYMINQESIFYSVLQLSGANSFLLRRNYGLSYTKKKSSAISRPSLLISGLIYPLMKDIPTLDPWISGRVWVLSLTLGFTV
jgi:hypothetical protein